MTSQPASSLDLAQARFNMIEQQVRPWEVLDRRVLDLLDSVPRDAFVPPSLQALAYSDMELPLTQPVREGACMLAPRLQARMVQDLNLTSNDKVLEIGTGSGYTAALMASLARQVVSLEIDPAIAAGARANLQKLGVTNVEVRVADATANGFAACSADGPWDAILVAGSVAEVPEVLLEQLAPNGRLIAITGGEPVMRASLITRAQDGRFVAQQPWDCNAPRLSHFPEPSAFQF